eukprot:gene9710-20189_t
MNVTKLISIDFDKLVSGCDLTDEIERAFGCDGLGILTVSNVPDLEKFRKQLLVQAREFANLDDDVKQKYTHAESFYNCGWSHGKEKFNGKADATKGSYYANPIIDQPSNNPEDIAKYPSFLYPNIWPTDEMPQFEPALKNLGRLIITVGKLLAKECDRYVISKCPQYEHTGNTLSHILETSNCCKARLLHYFPLTKEGDQHQSESEGTCDIESKEQEQDTATWCGWHNDHGSLTGLCAGMYLDSMGSVVSHPDPHAGLYVKARTGEIVHVVFPDDHIGFQIGETAQIHSGGLLQATPHSVRSSTMSGVSRESFAVFMEPMWFATMTTPEGLPLDAVQSPAAVATLPRGVPPLSSRWQSQSQPPMDFAAFTDATLKAYH